MIQISKEDYFRLDKAKLLKHTKGNKNYYIANRQKSSRAKTYIVAEEYKILKFLYPERYEEDNNDKNNSKQSRQKFKPIKK